jgi:hypothetical protein
MDRMLRLVLCALVLAPFAASPAHAQPGGHPSTLPLNGSATLPLTGQATRVHLLGQVEFYSLALYAAGTVDRARLRSDDVAKVLRIEVRFKEDFRRAIAIDWRRELIPALEPAAIEHLRQAFAPLQAGDVVLVEYLPGKGTTLRVNKSVA